jgi:hypothetical protein
VLSAELVLVGCHKSVLARDFQLTGQRVVEEEIHRIKIDVMGDNEQPITIVVERRGIDDKSVAEWRDSTRDKALGFDNLGVWQRFATKWAVVFTDSSHRIWE